MKDEKSEKDVDISYDLHDIEYENEDDDGLFDQNIDPSVDYAAMDFDAFMEDNVEIDFEKDGNSNCLDIGVESSNDEI